MGQGLSPADATRAAISKIVRFYPDFSGAIVAVNLKGEYGAACHKVDIPGMNGTFPYCVANLETGVTSVQFVKCLGGQG
jgi:N4-(beta-N-acetylglucosaminyl)-L-asparaginase